VKRLGLALAAAFVAGSFVLGASIRPSGIYPPEPPATTQTPPPAVPQMSGVETATACATNPGNPKGYCWYMGWKWPATLICIDSSIPGAPLGAVANLYRAIDTRLRVAAYIGAGQCAAHGYPRNRYVTFVPFTATDRVNNPRACAFTLAPNYGAFDLTASKAYGRPLVKVNLNGYKSTMCGTGPEWTDTFAHELGHVYGLSHGQPRLTSIMRDGHVLDAYDKYYIKMIMFGDARGVSVVPN